MTPTGYAAVQRETLTGRALEREVFSRITARMSEADQSTPAGRGAFIKAVYDNRRLWTILAADLAASTSQVPPSLRGKLISLAVFVEKYSAKVLDEGISVDPLVNINRSIIAGLSGKRAEAA